MHGGSNMEIYKRLATACNQLVKALEAAGVHLIGDWCTTADIDLFADLEDLSSTELREGIQTMQRELHILTRKLSAAMQPGAYSSNTFVLRKGHDPKYPGADAHEDWRTPVNGK